MGIVSFELDSLPPIPEEERARYKAMAEAQQAGVPNPSIDYSDIPKITSLDGWMTPEEFRAYRNAKAKQKILV